MGRKPKPRDASGSFLDSRKKLKFLYFSLRLQKFLHVLNWTEGEENTFNILAMNIRNNEWNERYLDLFKALDEINPREAIKFRKKCDYDSDCKHRCFTNLNKMCKEGILLKKRVEKLRGSIKKHHYQFLNIPKAWQEISCMSPEISQSAEEEMYGIVQQEVTENVELGMKIPYLNSPIVISSIEPFPIMDTAMNAVNYENVVFLHIPDVEDGSRGSISPASESASVGMKMSYLNLPFQDIPSESGHQISSGEKMLLQPLNSEKTGEENISPTSKIEIKGMKMLYLKEFIDQSMISSEICNQEMELSYLKEPFVDPLINQEASLPIEDAFADQWDLTNDPTIYSDTGCNNQEASLPTDYVFADIWNLIIDPTMDTGCDVNGISAINSNEILSDILNTSILPDESSVDISEFFKDQNNFDLLDYVENRKNSQLKTDIPCNGMFKQDGLKENNAELQSFYDDQIIFS